MYRKRARGKSPAILAACPPCQGMSSVRAKRGLAEDPDAGSRDGRNLLVVPIANVAQALRPRVVVVENVPAFFSRKVRHPRTGAGVTAAQLLTELLQPEYEAFPFLADLADYGVPQTRRRAFITFVRRGDIALQTLVSSGRAPYPKPTHETPGRRQRLHLREVLLRFGLPPLDASSPRTALAKRRRLHRVPVWTDARYAWVAAIPPGSGASAWENDRCGSCGGVAKDATRATCARCGVPLPRPVFKARNGRWRLIHGFGSSSYRRMAPDVPAATITTASGHIGSSRTIHPFENRILSPLECAWLQTFPRAFRWGRALDDWGHTFVRDLIGEAVPPRFTALHGRILGQLLSGVLPASALKVDNRRCIRGQFNLEQGHSMAFEDVERWHRHSRAAAARSWPRQ